MTETLNDIGIFIILYFFIWGLLSIEVILDLTGVGELLMTFDSRIFCEEIGRIKLFILWDGAMGINCWEGTGGGLFGEGISVNVLGVLDPLLKALGVFDPLLKVIFTWGLFELRPDFAIDPPL